MATARGARRDARCAVSKLVARQERAGGDAVIAEFVFRAIGVRKTTDAYAIEQRKACRGAAREGQRAAAQGEET